MTSEPLGLDAVVIFDDGVYTVVLDEVGPFWRWVIHQDGSPVHEGSSISENAARCDSEKIVKVFRRMGPSARAGSTRREDDS